MFHCVYSNVWFHRTLSISCNMRWNFQLCRSNIINPQINVMMVWLRYTQAVMLSGSWDSWASYFFSILILLEILTLPLHPHFLLASVPPPSPCRLSHTHTHVYTAQTHTLHSLLSYPHTCTLYTLLPLSLSISHTSTHSSQTELCVYLWVCVWGVWGGGYWYSVDVRLKKGRGEKREGGMTARGCKRRLNGRAKRDDKCVCVRVCVCNCWIACVPGGLVCEQAFEHTSKQAFSLFFIFLWLAALRVWWRQPCGDKRWESARIILVGRSRRQW